MPITSMM